MEEETAAQCGRIIKYNERLSGPWEGGLDPMTLGKIVLRLHPMGPRRTLKHFKERSGVIKSAF